MPAFVLSYALIIQNLPPTSTNTFLDGFKADFSFSFCVDFGVTFPIFFMGSSGKNSKTSGPTGHIQIFLTKGGGVKYQ